MSRQRGQAGAIVLIGIVILVLAVIGLFAVCTPGEDDHSLGRGPSAQSTRLASHEYRDCDPEWDDCGYGGGGNYGDGNYGQGRNSGGGGGNGNRGRRGDRQDSGRDSCHSFCGNTVVIPMPGETTTTTRGGQGD